MFIHVGISNFRTDIYVQVFTMLMNRLVETSENEQNMQAKCSYFFHRDRKTEIIPEE